jgi:hypothetical protein
MKPPGIPADERQDMPEYMRKDVVAVNLSASNL